MFRVFDDQRRLADVGSYLMRTDLRKKEYRHLWLLLYWPLYTVGFFLFELALPLTFHPIHCVLDDYIPFCEWFIFPYYWWFALLVGATLYTALCNTEVFYRFIWFIIASYTIALVCYALYPSCQELRPEVYPRDNAVTHLVQALHAFDSNENVCPSVHVLGAFGACVAGLQCRRFSGGWGRLILWLSMITVILSTVFIKQHSIIDVLVALAICGVLYPFTFGRKKRFYT